jgi:hypothetical protein
VSARHADSVGWCGLWISRFYASTIFSLHHRDLGGAGGSWGRGVQLRGSRTIAASTLHAPAMSRCASPSKPCLVLARRGSSPLALSTKSIVSALLRNRGHVVRRPHSCVSGLKLGEQLCFCQEDRPAEQASSSPRRQQLIRMASCPLPAAGPRGRSWPLSFDAHLKASLEMH